MRRLEKRVLRLNDDLAALAREEELVRGELEMHRSLADDAARDAAVYETPIERENAAESGKDVARFEKALANLSAKRRRLEAKRARLLERLAE